MRDSDRGGDERLWWGRAEGRAIKSGEKMARAESFVKLHTLTDESILGRCAGRGRGTSVSGGGGRRE